MGNLLVEQRTSDGMFNASLLLTQWNKHYGSDKKMNHFFTLKQTDAFINELLKGEFDENMHGKNSSLGDIQAVIVKKGKYSIQGRMPDEVWMHPYLFIKFAMWMNPTFEVYVIKFVYDSLIEYRKISSDLYIEMCNAINNYYICNYNVEASMEHYKMNAKIIQQLVFNKTFRSSPWQIACEKQLRLRTELQRILIASYSKDYDLEKINKLLESHVEIHNLI